MTPHPQPDYDPIFNGLINYFKEMEWQRIEDDISIHEIIEILTDFAKMEKEESATHTPAAPAPEPGLSKLCFGTITLACEECRACNEIETCTQKQKYLDYDKQQARKDERKQVLDIFAEVEHLHDVDGITYPDLYNEFIQRYKSLRGGAP